MKLIMDGDVDERSIVEVEPSDIRGYTRHHFFAGIGGWDVALQLAGWPDARPVWTGSCPCQPFSVAGKRNGKNDDRHLWPAFFELIKQFRPVTVFGEQVEGAVKYGWLDDLQTDLEREGYAVGAKVLGAHSVGSFHQRQRLYWMGGTNLNRCEPGGKTTEAARYRDTSDSASCRMDDSENPFRRWDCQEGIKGGWLEEIRGSNLWANPDWIRGRDGKLRPIKHGLEPCIVTLVAGLPGSVGHSSYQGEPINANYTQEARGMRLKGYGNAIVPQVAAEFISLFK
ncbi:MAG: DNA cytosine methyltransferase [Methylomicrobium sp.]|nr:DNA cytosine methyltransferase [Methylomicrobium sp.]